MEEEKNEITENMDQLKEIYDTYNDGLKQVDIDTKEQLGYVMTAANEMFMDKIDSLHGKKVLFNVSSDKKDQREPKGDEIIINIDEFFASLSGLVESLVQTEKEVTEHGPFIKATPEKKKPSALKRLKRRRKNKKVL